MRKKRKPKQNVNALRRDFKESGNYSPPTFTPLEMKLLPQEEMAARKDFARMKAVSQGEKAVKWPLAAEKEAEALKSLIDLKEELAGLYRKKARAARNKKYTELKRLLQSAASILCKNKPNLSSRLRIKRILLEKIEIGYDEKNPYIKEIASHLEKMSEYKISPGFIRKNITLPKRSPA